MSREAMQMALNALESDPISHAGLVSRKQAITALRQALETEQEPVAYWNTDESSLSFKPGRSGVKQALKGQHQRGRVSRCTQALTGLGASLHLSQHMKEKPASRSLKRTESLSAILRLESLLVNGLTERCTKLETTSEQGVSNDNK